MNHVCVSSSEPSGVATPPVEPNRPEGAVLIRYGQCCNPTGPRVQGSGYMAKAALVDALVEDGAGEAAGEVARCGSFILKFAGALTLHESDSGGRFLGGLNHCGRNPCPVCGPYIMTQRIAALRPVVKRLSQDPGLRFFFVVLTLRHRKGARFKDLVKVLRACQRGLVQDKGHWGKVVRGWIRMMENTYGKNGHHPHENLILAVDASLDTVKFFTWLEEKFAKTAKKYERTAAWAPGWCREVPREELMTVVNYLGADDKLGRAPGALREALGAPYKHQPLWAIPSRPFEEIWFDSKGFRWFGTGGLFKGTDADKTDEEISEVRNHDKPTIAHVPDDVYLTWTPREKRDRQAVMVDRSLSMEQVIVYVLAIGGKIGPKPDLYWGSPDG